MFIFKSRLVVGSAHIHVALQLAEIFQWFGDSITIDSIEKEKMDKIGQEIADCSIYILRLSDVCNIKVGVQAMSILEIVDDGTK